MNLVISYAKNKSNIHIDCKNSYLRILHQNNFSASYPIWLNDPEVNKFLSCRFKTYSLRDCQDYIENSFLLMNEFLFGIIDKGSDKHIGNVKIGPIDMLHATAQIGLFIGDKTHWGRGIATNVIQGLSNWAFNELKLEKLEAGCYEENFASKKAFLNSGFNIEGFLKDHFRYRDGRTGVYLFGKILSS